MNLLLLLLPLLFITTTTSTATIPPGSSLYASNTSQTWSSPNNAFFLGFTRVDPTSYVISISTATGVPIWTTVNRTTSAAVVDSGGVFQFLSNGNLRLRQRFSSRGSENVAYANDYDVEADVVRFMRLSSDGNLRMYSGGTTAMTWAALADQCQVYGYCGNMGICSYMESSSSPICKCPSLNFEAVDVNDRRKGCKRKVEVENCAGNVAMLELKQTKFFTFQDQQIVTIGITACRGNCLSSTSCFASTSLSDTNAWCYMKNTPDFVSGYQGPVLLSTSFLKVCGPVQPNPSPLEQSGGDKKCWKLRVWAGGVAATISVMAASSGLFWWFCRKNSPKFGSVLAQYTLLEYASGVPVQFSYKDLHRWTKGFKDKLGTGGFGAVYRGVLPNRTAVAVKKLEGIEQGEKQFRMEVATISSTHHLNLVRLIGFCSEGRHRVLVYEFMRNGSLDHFLFRTENQPGTLLDWKNRFKIALGTARGITYLHEECRDCIVHCDIKTENILVDESFNARVSDFGLAKLISSKDQRFRSLTTIRGTETVSGRRNFEVSAEINEKFSEWAYGEFEKGNVEAIVDRRLSDQVVDMEEVTRAVQEHPSRRPTMGKVVQMLEGIVEIGMPPPLKASLALIPPPSSSSSSSFQTEAIPPFISERIMEKQSSSLLQPFQIKSL
uniref:Protein kinase domain-containing protein n=1 Tax=Salix viminalis TaxID=40686 RepID=A0A6N2LVP9_SALVM